MDNEHIEYERGFPKRIKVSCYCHDPRPYSFKVAAKELCNRCKAWEAFFDRQYEEICEKEGIPVDNIIPTLGI